MTKKEFLPMPFVLGIGIMVLVITTAIVLASPLCNRYSPSGQAREDVTCMQNFTNAVCHPQFQLTGKCDGEEGALLLVASSNQRHFSRTFTGGAWHNAVVAGLSMCGYVYICEIDQNGFCVATHPKIVPPFGQPEPLTIPYYGNWYLCIPLE